MFAWTGQERFDDIADLRRDGYIVRDVPTPPSGDECAGSLRGQRRLGST
jgi:hypothetical protein